MFGLADFNVIFYSSDHFFIWRGYLITTNYETPVFKGNEIKILDWVHDIQGKALNMSIKAYKLIGGSVQFFQSSTSLGNFRGRKVLFRDFVHFMRNMFWAKVWNKKRNFTIADYHMYKFLNSQLLLFIYWILK